MRVQRAVAPEKKSLVPYIRPPVFALIYAPFTRFPLQTAFAIWVAGQLAALLVAGWWVARRFGSDGLVYFAFFQPAVYAVFNGQDAAVLLLAVLGGFELLERKREFAAGLVLGIVLLKFHLVFLLPVALLLNRRLRMLAGFAITGAAQFLICLALVGVSGLQSYARLLARKDLVFYEPTPYWMPNLRGLASNLGLDAMPVTVVVGALLLWAMWRVRGAATWQWMGVALMASMLLATHGYPYDVTELLPFAMFAVFHGVRKVTKFAAASMLLPLPYLVVFLGPPVAIVMQLVILATVFSMATDPVNTEAEPKLCAG